MVTTRQVLKTIAKSQRDAERYRQAQIREQQKAVKEYQKAKLAYEKATEKERAKLYTKMRQDQVAMQNEDLDKFIERLGQLLLETLSVDDYLDFETLKKKPQIPPFASSIPEPKLETYQIPPMTMMQKLMPGAKAKHDKQLEEAQKKHQAHVAAYEKIKRDYAATVAKIRKEVEEHNETIDLFKKEFDEGNNDAICKYFAMVLEASSYPSEFPQHAKLAYVPESKQLVIEYDLPQMDIVPVVAAYKYTASRDEISSTARPATQIRTIYSSVISQLTLRTIHELFEADRTGHIDIIVFNGYVDTVDKATGRDIRPCLVTVRTSKETFMAFNLSRVDPATCLKSLHAEVSKSPSELLPVKPVLELNMVDSRFVEEADIISGLDQRPNLMELSPQEFESLITNLFQKMGLETRLTQASRDGGVDCVAFDSRPIFGGKVVIQAKRYKNTVGVSAVRDLYGTVMNEGASKGIIVATSGFGKAAFEFANGKPLELIAGGQLLYLLEEHAAVKAKIEIPDTWKDPILAE